MSPATFITGEEMKLVGFIGEIGDHTGHHYQDGLVKKAEVAQSCLILTPLMCVLVALSCLTLCDPLDCSPPGSSIHGILQARILECVAFPFSRGSS